MDIVFGLLSALGFGLADFLARFSTHRLGVYRTLLYTQLVGLLVLTVYLLVTGSFSHLSVGTPWLWGLLAALINSFGYLFLYRAFAVGQLAVVSPIASSYAAVTVILSILSGEQIILLQGVGIIAVLFGVFLASLQKEDVVEEINAEDKQLRKQRFSTLQPGVLWAILAALCLGLTFWMLGFAVTPSLGDTLPIWLFRLVAVCVIAPLAIKEPQHLPLWRGSSIGLVIGAGLLDLGAFIASTLGFSLGSVAIVSVLSSLYSVVAIMLAWIFLKEKLRPIQWTGIVLLLIGIALTHV